MALKPLSLDNIQFGALREQVDEALEKISKDVIDRDKILKRRKVVVEISIEPRLSATGTGTERNFPVVKWSVDSKLPCLEGTALECVAQGDTLMINTGALDRPAEPTFLDGEKASVEEVTNEEEAE